LRQLVTKPTSNVLAGRKFGSIDNICIEWSYLGEVRGYQVSDPKCMLHDTLLSYSEFTLQTAQL
jgi:hypothetical protein